MKCVKVLKDKRFIAILLAALVRMGYLGFTYYPLLDDYIQHGIYPWVENPFRKIYLNIGLFAARPLAGLADIYVWGRFWNNMMIPLLVITILHALSAYIFILTSGKLNMPMGVSFAVFYVLCPINFEGAYWISASSRIVVGMFFACVSAYYLAYGKNISFFIFQFLSMFLYEQVAVFSFVLSSLIILSRKDKKAWYYLTVNIITILLYYKTFSNMGRHSERVALQFFNIDAIWQNSKTWAQWELFSNGFSRGMSMTTVYFIPVFIAAALLGVAENAKKFCLKQIAVGAVLFITPYLPFFMLSNNHASFRTALVPLLGLAIIADSLFNLVKYAKPAIVVALSLFFIIISVSELVDYQQNYFIDRRIISRVAKGLDSEMENAVVGAKETYINQNVFYAEHIKSIASSNWALTGALREYFGNPTLPMIEINPKNSDNKNLISLYDF